MARGRPSTYGGGKAIGHGRSAAAAAGTKAARPPGGSRPKAFGKNVGQKVVAGAGAKQIGGGKSGAQTAKAHSPKTLGKGRGRTRATRGVSGSGAAGAV